MGGSWAALDLGHGLVLDHGLDLAHIPI